MSELWSGLDLHIQIIIQLAAGVTALSVLGVVMFKAAKGTSRFYQRFAWLFNEQHDHEIIKQTLEDIKGEFTSNGGSTLKDVVIDIRDELAFNSSYMRTALHVQRVAMFETDVDGRVTYVNRAFIRMVGFSAHEIMGQGWINIIAADKRDAMVDKWMDAVTAKRDFDDIVPYVRADGSRFTAHVTAHTIRVEGRMAGHIGEVIPLPEATV